MSRQITLTACSGCGRGYRLRDTHEVDGKIYCEACYERVVERLFKEEEKNV